MALKANDTVINDARSFYAAIKGNPLYKQIEDQDAIAALEDYFAARFKAANSDNLMGIKRDRYQFFQGMLAGCLVQSKIYRHHLVSEAAASNVDLQTGEKYVKH